VGSDGDKAAAPSPVKTSGSGSVILEERSSRNLRAPKGWISVKVAVWIKILDEFLPSLVNISISWLAEVMSKSPSSFK